MTPLPIDRNSAGLGFGWRQNGIKCPRGRLVCHMSLFNKAGNEI